jgi:hypothetical protein
LWLRCLRLRLRLGGGDLLLLCGRDLRLLLGGRDLLLIHLHLEASFSFFGKPWNSQESRQRV